MQIKTIDEIMKYWAARGHTVEVTLQGNRQHAYIVIYGPSGSNESRGYPDLDELAKIETENILEDTHG